jgi:F0F1-type ATP synthase membrane subunit a
MNNDDYLKKVTSKLDGLARQHQGKAQVMNNVLATVQKQPRSHYGTWRMSGFALAAAIAGFIVLPNTAVFDEQPQTQLVANPKLSPQMMEDLEMLMVLGEDKEQHGS